MTNENPLALFYIFDRMKRFMNPAKPILSLESLKKEATFYGKMTSNKHLPELYGVSDGKAVGTYIEQDFKKYLATKYEFVSGNSATGIDLPSLGIDIKVTSITQPQSSCPYKDATQKVYGLGYHLLVFVYDKKDDASLKVAKMDFLHCIFVDSTRTADFQTTQGIIDILKRKGNEDDISAFITERNLPLDEIGREKLVRRIMSTPPAIGYLTISNALQWRLQYKRVIDMANKSRVDGLEELVRKRIS